MNADGTPAETSWNYSAANDGLVSIQFENVAVSENGIFGIAGWTQDQGILVNHVGGGFDGLGGAEWGPVDVFAGNGDIIMDVQQERLVKSAFARPYYGTGTADDRYKDRACSARRELASHRSEGSLTRLVKNRAFNAQIVFTIKFL